MDRVAKKGVHRTMIVAAIAIGAASAFILAVTWAPTLWAAQLLAVPSGLLGGGWAVGILAGLQYVLPERQRATGTALALMIVSLFGNFVGPWAAGLMSDAFADDPALGLRIGLSVIIPMGFIGAILVWRSAKTLEQDRIDLARENYMGAPGKPA
jgi:MFS family permease